MNSILKITALAASMAVASAQTFPNSTVVPSVSTVPGYQYIGCVSISSGAGFTTLQSSAAMTEELCASFAVSFPYFAVSGSICLGGTAINSTQTFPQSSCNLRCPGDASSICGGNGLQTVAKRQVAGAFYSLYQSVAVIPTGQVVNTIITNVFVDIDINLGTFATVTAISTATLTGCGCTTQSVPTIACSATTLYCSVCATPGPVTVTVPAGVTAGNAAAPTVTVAAGSAADAAASAAAAAAAAAAPAAAAGAAAASEAAAAGSNVYTGAAAQNIVSGAAVLGAIAVLAL